MPNDTFIGLIAGGGQFPLLFAEGAKEAGYRVVAVGFDGETDPALATRVDSFHSLKLGQLNKLIRIFQKADIQRVAMAGSINKTRLYTKIRPDWRAFKLLAALRNKKDDHLLRALAAELEKEGIRVEPSTLFLPGLLAPEGLLTRRHLNAREQRDVIFGWEMAKAVGHLDIGQCLVVKDQAVLAVEGIDGTDETILRGGRLCREGAVVIKVSKPIQDLRFDVPAVGLQTIETMRSVKARVLVVEAGKTLIFDREKVVEAADRYGMSLVAISDPLATADAKTSKENASGSTTSETLRPLKPVAIIRHADPEALRTAVVGAGYLGTFHAEKYARLKEAHLVGVADIDGERAQALASRLGCAAYTDHRHLLGAVDAVSIVTPTPEHFTVARDFLEAGVHVLVEKPLTQSLEEAEELVRLSETKGVVLQVGHLERFNPAFKAVEPYIVNPLFLEAHRLALFNERGLEVDVILDLMIHDLDVVLHLVRSPVETFSASGVPVLTPLPDIANVRLEFRNGAVANLTASRISMKNMRRLRIFQENRYLVADYGNRRAFSFLKEAAADEEGYPEISSEELEVENRDPLEEEIRSFLEAVRSGTPPLVDGRQGLEAVRLALAVSRQICERMHRTRIQGIG
ncbi:MAG: UDP-2,3-diacylglucosamine diphosphatase LpxI [Desulfosoma sp.]